MKTIVLLFVLGFAAVAAKKCGKNEFFSPSDCNGCDLTCKTKESGICAAVCRPPKCMCKPGFYRNDNNECVGRSQCPVEAPQCGKNEYFASSDCNGCDMTCFQRDHTICASVCHPAQCMCKPGFYRDPMGRCVAPQNCPAVQPPVVVRPTPAKVVCKENEHFAQGDCLPCDMTCYGREHTLCPAICRTARCLCNEGFYRNHKNRCVAPENCPKLAVF